MYLSRRQRACFFWIIYGFLFNIYPLFSLPCNAATDNENIERLIEQLGNTNFGEREAATKRLRKIGKPALPALRKARASDDLEVRRRVNALITALETGVAPLLSLGARLELNYKVPGRPVRCAYLEGPVFHDEDLIHLHDFDQLENLSLWRSRITDAGLDHIGHCPNLTGLTLSNTSVTELAILRRLKKLKGLGLSSTRISDAALVHLEGLTQLESLSLSRTTITGAGLEHIKYCKKMYGLHLESAINITDDGLVYLEEMTQLRILDLTNTKITDAGLKHLKDLHNMTHLLLSGTKITNAGLVHLRELKHLSFLSIDETKVSDAGLVHLRELKKLRDLTINGTSVTKSGITELKRSLPNVDVTPSNPK